MAELNLSVSVSLGWPQKSEEKVLGAVLSEALGGNEGPRAGVC